MYKSCRPDGRPAALPLPPMLALNPFLLAVSAASGLAGSAMLTTRWLSFVSHRLGEDARLLGELTASKSPVEFWGRYSDFVLAAIQNYGREWTELTKLAGANLEKIVEHAGHERAAPDKEQAAPVARAA